MPWDINQINREFMSNLPQPGEAFQAGQDESFKRRALASQLAAQQQQQALAQQRAQQKQIDVQSFIQNPTAQGAAALQAAYPEDREAYKGAWETRDTATKQSDLRELSSIHGYLQAGRPQDAATAIRRRIDADKKAGQDTSEDEQFLAVVEQDPNAAKGQMALMLASIVGPDKFDAVFKNVGDSQRADAKLPGEVALTEAQAGKAAVEAQMAPDIIASDLATQAATRERQAAQTAIDKAQLALGWERLGLDKDTLMTNTQMKLQELQQAGAEVKGASLDELTKAVGSSQQSNALAERSKALADQLAASGARGGIGSSWAEWLKTSTGNQDAVSALRTQYSRLTNSIAIKNLPPGSASDKDVAFALKGFPRPSDPPEYLAQFLRGVAKLETLNAQADDRKADWISRNGNLGTAKRDINVAGVNVPAGTTFSEFNRNSVKTGKAGQAPERGYLDKYGR